LQCSRVDPTPGVDLGGIDLDPVIAATDEHRAQLVLGAGRAELRLVPEFEQKMQATGQAQLLLQPAVDGTVHALGPSRVAAAAVGPVQGPEPFSGRALLKQQLAVPIENQQGKRPMQHAAASVTVGAVQMADFAVGIVYEYQGLRICQRNLTPK